MASFGMMNEAYFVGKNILIDWVNNFLEIHIDKVEECANGAIYCNLFDALHPGTIPMSKVDFTVKYDHEFVKNWKLLQNAFQKTGIEKVIPVERLIKARYQDNLEFLQWFYKYARDTYNGDPDEPAYDARGRRAKSKGGRDYSGSKNAKNAPIARKNGRSSVSANNGNGSRAPRPISAQNKSGYGANQSNINIRNQSNSSLNGRQRSADNEELQSLRSENQRLLESYNEAQQKFDQSMKEQEELENIARDIEKERDFYFNKVLAIEQLLKEQPDQSLPVIADVFKILYQTDNEQKENVQESSQPSVDPIM
jgi:RP/EB family microtubule-associated protein